MVRVKLVRFALVVFTVAVEVQEESQVISA